MVPGEASLRGKQAIRAYLERSARVPGFRISWEPLEAKIAASGDMGYLIERTQVTMNDPSGQPVTQTMKALTVWRKQSDGSWKNVVDMTNPEARPLRRCGLSNRAGSCYRFLR
jgi:ketosteroid isomerase-like protein